jgi:cytochrome c-type biogenesis protein
MKRFKKHFTTLEKIMGLLLIVTGLLFIFGAQNWFSQWMIEHFPSLARVESMITPANLGSEILKQGTP